MARPKMKFTPKEAVSLIHAFKAGLDDDEFCAMHLVKEPGTGSAISSLEPKQALAPLASMARATWSRTPGDAVPFPEEGCGQLKDWITTWVSPEGWTRLLATRRQRALKERRRSSATREATVDMPNMAAHQLLNMAERVGMDRKTYVGRLVTYLEYDQEGKNALQRFERELQNTRRAEAVKLLVEAFGCTPGHHEEVLQQLLREGFAPQDLAIQSAMKAGKTKLAKLAVLAKKLAPDNALRFALLPQARLAGRSPLVALSEGEPLTALQPMTSAT